MSTPTSPPSSSSLVVRLVKTRRGDIVGYTRASTRAGSPYWYVFIFGVAKHFVGNLYLFKLQRKHQMIVSSLKPGDSFDCAARVCIRSKTSHRHLRRRVPLTFTARNSDVIDFQVNGGEVAGSFFRSEMYSK